MKGKQMCQLCVNLEVVLPQVKDAGGLTSVGV